MSEPFDIIALGDAIVDVLARRDDTFLQARGVVKGSMTLIDDARAADLAQALAEGGAVTEVPGGSAANTLAGAVAAGARCAFVGQTGDDRLGALFAADLRAQGIGFATPPLAGAATGRCFIVIGPDGERTMQTASGASHSLTADALDEAAIRAARVLFLEGYLWGPEAPRAAMRRAIEWARAEGQTIALTLSDSIALPGRRDSLAQLVADGAIDILFANEAEACLLAGECDIGPALAKLAPQVAMLVVTRGPRGALGLSHGMRAEIAAMPVAQVIDTTGAGDQFAAGFLAAHVQGADMATALAAGAGAAAAIIAHVGARPSFSH